MSLLEKTLKALEKTNLTDLRAYDLGTSNPFFDIVIVATSNPRQNQAVIGYLKEELKNIYEIKGIEGNKSGWTLIDLGEVIVNLFDEETRDYYKFDEKFIGVKEIKL